MHVLWSSRTIIATEIGMVRCQSTLCPHAWLPVLLSNSYCLCHTVASLTLGAYPLIPTYTLPYIHIHVNIHSPLHPHTCQHTLSPTSTYMSTYTLPYIHVHVNIHSPLHPHTCQHTLSPTSTYMSTYLHTHSNTSYHMHMHMVLCPPVHLQL